MFGKRTPDVTHDYTRRHLGHNYSIMGIHDGGKRLHVCGWGNGIEAGHFLLMQNGEGSTRYRVKEVSYYGNPDDMWKATLIFAPRKRVSLKASDASGDGL